MPAPSRLAAALALAACAVSPTGAPPRAPAAAPAPGAPQGPPTRILSAHAQAPAADAGDYFGVSVGTLVYVVFSRPLDPASLVPTRFVVLARDGTRRVPVAAALAPASERDELRALELVVPAPQRELVSVTVIGQIFDVDGRDLDGLAADVAGADLPAFPVFAERVSQGTGCPEGNAARVWWSVPVAAGPAGVRLQLGDGRALPPLALADVACPPGLRLADDGPDCDPVDDSVLDYCAPAGASVERVELEPGAVRDRAGRPGAGGTLVLQDMTART